MAYNPAFADVTNTVNISANATPSGACVATGGAAVFTVQLSGTWVATVQVQVTRDGTNWVNVTGSNMIQNAATGAYVASGNITANGVYQVDVAGIAAARVITTAYTSGTIGGATAIGQAPGPVSIEGVPSVNATVSGSLTSAGTTTSTPAAPTSYNVVTAASTNAANIKASGGTLYEITVSNVTATAAYVKLYNKASNPTVGTDVPVLTIPVAAGATVPMSFGPLGKRFNTGLSIAVTAAAAATDTAATVAGIQINAGYI